MWGAVLVLVTVLAGLAATRLRINANILELLPPDDPTTLAIQRINDEEGGANVVTLTLEGEDAAALRGAAQELAGRLEGLEGVEYVLYDIEPDLAWRLGVLQLRPDELALLQGRLQQALALGPALANPFIAGTVLDLGPLTARLNAEAGQASLFGGAEGRARILVRPTGTAYDPAFSRPFMERLYATIDAVGLEARGVRMGWVGGAYRHSVEDVENIRADFSRTGLLSFAAVLLLVVFAYRDWRPVVLFFVPLVAANVWTTGLVALTIGTLNTFTSFFPAILFGLGVDFAIHLYGRYQEERARANSLEDAIARAWDHVGPPAAAAAVTSVAGFLSLRAAGFQGFQQLGLILAVGLFFCFAAAIVGLPVLLRLLAKAPRPLPLRVLSEPRERRPPVYRLAPLGLVLAGVVSVGALFVARRIQFEYDISEIRAHGLAYHELSATEREAAEASFAPVIVSFSDDAALREAHARIAPKVAAGEVDVLRGAVSIYSVLPLDQDARVAQLQAIAALARDPNVAFLPPPVRANLERIAATEPRVLSPADLPPGLVDVLGAADGRHRLMLLPKGNMWDLREDRKLLDFVHAELPGASAAGEYLAMAVLYGLVQDDGVRVALVALLGVFVVTLLDVRRPARAFAVVAALLAGTSWAAAGMVFAGIKLTLVNFVALPILLGIGVDVVIHMMHRLSEEGPGRVVRALSTTGFASGLSSLTTIISFGSLVVANAEGVRDLGVLIAMGLTLVTLSGLTLVPLGWMTVWKVAGRVRRGGPGSAP